MEVVYIYMIYTPSQEGYNILYILPLFLVIAFQSSEWQCYMSFIHSLFLLKWGVKVVYVTIYIILYCPIAPLSSNLQYDSIIILWYDSIADFYQGSVERFMHPTWQIVLP